MKRSRFSEEQIIGILREAEAGSPVKAVCAAHNISTATYHAWKRKFGGMEVSEAKRLRGLEEENSRLKRLVADQAVQIHMPQRGQCKKVVSPSARRRAVKMSMQEGLGRVAAACRALGLSRSSYYRRGGSSLESRRIRKEVLELSGKYPRYGYPPHYRADAAGWVRDQWETRGADSTRRRNQSEEETAAHEAFRDLDGRAAAC